MLDEDPAGDALEPDELRGDQAVQAAPVADERAVACDPDGHLARERRADVVVGEPPVVAQRRDERIDPPPALRTDGGIRARRPRPDSP